MARYNEILVGRYNRAAQKHFQMKGGASLAQLDDTLSMTIPFFWGAESRYLESWNRFAFLGAVAAGGAGTFATVRLTNPKGSNVVAVLEKIAWNSIVAAITTMLINLNRPALANLATVSGGLALDARSVSGQTAQSNLLPSFGTPASTFGNSIGALTLPASGGTVDAIATDIQEIPLLPGDGIDFVINAANVALSDLVLWWRERFLEEGERT